VRRAILAAAGAALTLLTYVGWWCLHYWDRDNRPGSRPFAIVPYQAFTPIEWYASGSLPGSDQLCTLQEWAGGGGNRSWEECRVAMKYNKYGIDIGTTQPGI
jgi:hypothetical protein